MPRIHPMESIPDDVQQRLAAAKSDPARGIRRAFSAQEPGWLGVGFRLALLVVPLVIGFIEPGAKPFVIGIYFLAALWLSWDAFSLIAAIRSHRKAMVKPMALVTPGGVMRVELDHLKWARIDEVQQVSHTEVMQGNSYRRTDIHLALGDGSLQLSIHNKALANDFVAQLMSNRDAPASKPDAIVEALEHLPPGPPAKRPFAFRRALAAAVVALVVAASGWLSGSVMDQRHFAHGNLTSIKMQEYYFQRYTMQFYADEVRWNLVDAYKEEWKTHGKKHSLEYLTPEQKRLMEDYYRQTRPNTPS